MLPPCNFYFQTHGWTLIGSGAHGLGILECVYMKFTVAGVALIKPSETLNKDKFVFVSEFSWLLEHPVYQIILHYLYNISDLFKRLPVFFCDISYL